MATPEKPTLDYSYTAFQQAQGDNTFPGTQIDNDLANLKSAIDETIDFTTAIIRSDGKLNNGVVTKSSLDSSIVLGLAPPRPWAVGGVYAVDDTVTRVNELYICMEAHTAGSDFTVDLGAGKWAVLASFAPLTVVSDGSITEPKHATGGVSTRALADGAVSTAKYADGSITRAKAAANFGLMPIGATLEWDGPIAPSGWVFKFGQALSRVTYSALMSALTATITCNATSGSNVLDAAIATDLRHLGLEGCVIEGPGLPTNTTIVSIALGAIVVSTNATLTTVSSVYRVFPCGNGDGSTTFNVPDDRDYVSVGRGNMGGSAASRISLLLAGASNLNTSRLSGVGGTDRHALLAAQVPPLSGSTDFQGEHQHTFSYNVAAGLVAVSGGPNFNVFTNNLGISSGNTALGGSHQHAVTVNGSGGAAHPNVQPSRVTNKIIFTGVV